MLTKEQCDKVEEAICTLNGLAIALVYLTEDTAHDSLTKLDSVSTISSYMLPELEKVMGMF